MRASEIRTRSVTPCFSSLAGIGRCPHSGIPGPPTGPALRSTITLVGVAVEVGVVHPGREIVDVLEDDRAALVLQEGRLGGADLHHGAVGAEAAGEDDERAAAVERIVGRPDHLRVHDLGTGDVLAHRLPRHRDRRRGGADPAICASTAGRPPA